MSEMQSRLARADGRCRLELIYIIIHVNTALPKIAKLIKIPYIWCRKYCWSVTCCLR